MRRIYINDGWIFFPLWTPECIRTLCGFAGRKVRIPHVDEEWAGQGRENGCGYIYMLTVPESFSGRQLWLTFEGVGPKAWVFVNGSLAGHHCGWDRAFSLDISPYIHFGSENRIAIKLESGREDRVLEKMAPGIYRSVYIEVRNPVHIEDIFIRTKIRKNPGKWVGAGEPGCQYPICSLQWQSKLFRENTGIISDMIQRRIFGNMCF